jgi:Flp pilus assembly protein TadG
MHNRKVVKKLAPALEESGAVAVTFALAITALCGFVALAVDLGHIVKAKTELQRTADAAALAGAMGLVPYTYNTATSQTPNWLNGQNKAHAIISHTANQVDNYIFSTSDGTVLYGYWLVHPPAGYVQPPLSTAKPTTAAFLPEPAINVTLSRNVTLSFAPMVGVSSPKTVSATATAILPEAYQTTNIPPIAVSQETVYNTSGQSLTIDVAEQAIKIQSNKGDASWFNLDGSNSVPSVRINTPLTSAQTQIYLVPGTKATLTDLVSEGETIVLPVVDTVADKEWRNIIGWGAFKIDSLSSNSMTGHFVNQYYDPNVVPTAGSGIISDVGGTPKLVRDNVNTDY